MTSRISSRCSVAAGMLCAIALSACSTQPGLYEWGSYQAKVYEQLKAQGGDPQQQILDLERDLDTIAAKGKTPPPGFHAHLGLLYLTVGKSDLAAQSWNKEKALFPESAKYMDFLLNNMKKQGG